MTEPDKPQAAGETTATAAPLPPKKSARGHKKLALVIVWSADEPQRVGESAVVSGTRAHVLGRDLSDFSASGRPLLFTPRRQSADDGGQPIKGRAISRRQLEIHAERRHLEVTNVGRCALLLDGEPVDNVSLEVGDIIVLHTQLALLCVEHEPLGDLPASCHPFGAPDAFGMVGESAAAWALRKHIAICAGGDQHVLITGATGSGKELVARALHGLSPRADGEMVARNAATLPQGIIDAELFGNAKNYPNPGMPERLGLIGSANGSHLYLDEIGELSQDLQSHLLRVMDNGGEYQRLGEDNMRHSSFRVVAATNQPLGALRKDFEPRAFLSESPCPV